MWMCWTSALTPFFLAVVLFCTAALIFPMGFYIDEVGGQPYKLPNNTVVGSSYVLFVLSIFFTIVGLLFAGKVCLPGWRGRAPSYFRTLGCSTGRSQRETGGSTFLPRVKIAKMLGTGGEKSTDSRLSVLRSETRVKWLGDTNGETKAPTPGESSEGRAASVRGTVRSFYIFALLIGPNTILAHTDQLWSRFFPPGHTYKEKVCNDDGVEVSRHIFIIYLSLILFKVFFVLKGLISPGVSLTWIPQIISEIRLHKVRCNAVLVWRWENQELNLQLCEY